MLSLFFFSVSLLCSALSMKVGELDGAKAVVPRFEGAPAEVVGRAIGVGSHSIARRAIGGASATTTTAPADPRALLTEAETRFYSILKIAVERFDCQVLAKVHLPALTKRADESLQPAAALNRALAALRCWEADFAICRGDSLVVAAVVRLRCNDESILGVERVNLEEALHCTLAAARIPVVLVAETDSYDAEAIETLIRPHLAEAWVK